MTMNAIAKPAYFFGARALDGSRIACVFCNLSTCAGRRRHFLFFSAQPFEKSRFGQRKTTKCKPFCLDSLGFAWRRLAPWLRSRLGFGIELRPPFRPSRRLNLEQ